MDKNQNVVEEVNNNDLKTPASAIVSLVFGIISVFAYFLVFPPLTAVISGIIGLANFDKNKHKHKGFATAGLILGFIYTFQLIIKTILL